MVKPQDVGMAVHGVCCISMGFRRLPSGSLGFDGVQGTFMYFHWAPWFSIVVLIVPWCSIGLYWFARSMGLYRLLWSNIFIKEHQLNLLNIKAHY